MRWMRRWQFQKKQLTHKIRAMPNIITASDILQGKILLVDDKKANIMLLEKMLHGAGYVSITSTMDSGQVCELHRRNSYDLILLDLQMPGMDGFEVMEKLKEIESSNYLPVLVITAQPDHKLRALNAGAKDFVSKPFDLAEVLLRVHNMLEVRMLYRRSMDLNDRIIAEQKVSERLLLNVLPKPIVERLKGYSEIVSDNNVTAVIADNFSEATVLFADIVGFTQFSKTVRPDVLIEVLNDIFTRFDAIADNCGLEKIKTIGDSYMAVAGLPVYVADHAVRTADMALDMIGAMDDFNAHSPYYLQIRIGIDTGPVIAGIIGKRKFLYDLWGDVVNTASRMESQGVAGRIQITDSTRDRLNDLYILESRGPIDVKGMDEMHTWFLNSRSNQGISATSVFAAELCA